MFLLCLCGIIKHQLLLFLMSLDFNIQHTNKEGNARTGEIITSHGNIETPVFMPVGTAGTVKAVTQQQLQNDIKAQIILGNTYHL